MVVSIGSSIATFFSIRRSCGSIGRSIATFVSIGRSMVVTSAEVASGTTPRSGFFWVNFAKTQTVGLFAGAGMRVWWKRPINALLCSGRVNTEATRETAEMVGVLHEVGILAQTHVPTLLTRRYNRIWRNGQVLTEVLRVWALIVGIMVVVFMAHSLVGVVATLMSIVTSRPANVTPTPAFMPTMVIPVATAITITVFSRVHAQIMVRRPLPGLTVNLTMYAIFAICIVCIVVTVVVTTVVQEMLEIPNLPPKLI